MMEFLVKMVKTLKALVIFAKNLHYHITCSKLAMQTPEQCVKYDQS